MPKKKLSVDEKFNLIKRNAKEILTEKELRDLLSKDKQPIVYWGTAITGTPHIGYFFPVLKLADFLKTGFRVVVLFADLHGALDNCPWSLLEKRYQYYKQVIPLMFKAVGASIADLRFVKGSEIQLTKKYVTDLFKLSTMTSVHDAKKSAAEVVKFDKNPKVGGLIYPLMQALDEVYLNADVQFAGLDQRKIMVFARENLPKIGYKQRVEVMIPMVPGLIGKKMSASDEKSKVDLLDTKDNVRKKIRSAEFLVGNADNGVMAFLKYVIMTLKGDKKEKFIVKRDKKYGGDLIYESYKDIEKDIKNKTLHPLDLKNAVAEEINSLLSVFRGNKEKLEKLKKAAYS